MIYIYIYKICSVVKKIIIMSTNLYNVCLLNNKILQIFLDLIESDTEENNNCNIFFDAINVLDIFEYIFNKCSYANLWKEIPNNDINLLKLNNHNHHNIKYNNIRTNILFTFDKDDTPIMFFKILKSDENVLTFSSDSAIENDNHYIKKEIRNKLDKKWEAVFPLIDDFYEKYLMKALQQPINSNIILKNQSINSYNLSTLEEQDCLKLCNNHDNKEEENCQYMKIVEKEEVEYTYCNKTNSHIIMIDIVKDTKEKMLIIYPTTEKIYMKQWIKNNLNNQDIIEKLYLNQLRPHYFKYIIIPKIYIEKTWTIDSNKIDRYKNSLVKNLKEATNEICSWQFLSQSKINICTNHQNLDIKNDDDDDDDDDDDEHLYELWLNKSFIFINLTKTNMIKHIGFYHAAAAAES